MAVAFQDYYSVLGVPRDANADDIKKAFRSLARKHHPDTATDKKNAEEKFKEINEAYEVLSDPEKRKKYDLLGENWKDGSGFQPPPGWQPGGRAQAAYSTPPNDFHFDGTGFSDFFEQFFGGARPNGFEDAYGGGGRYAQAAAAYPQRGGDIEGDILVTLDEILHGSSRTISLQRVDQRTGKTESDTIKVHIPTGIQDGQKVRVRGKGQEGISGGEPGDLFLRVRVAAHPDFRTREADLYYTLDLAPWEGVLGTSVNVPVPGGNEVKVRIPAGTNNAHQLRVRGQGLPKGKTGERGDLYVVVNVQLPTSPGPEERELWEKLSQVSTFKPRQLP